MNGQTMMTDGSGQYFKCFEDGQMDRDGHENTSSSSSSQAWTSQLHADGVNFAGNVFSYATSASKSDFSDSACLGFSSGSCQSLL